MAAIRFCILLALAGCASAPAELITDGEEDLMVETNQWVAPTGMLGFGTATAPTLRILEGARCTLSNDKGSWTVATPGTARIRLSSQPLKVECVKEGFRPASETLKCVSLRQQSATRTNVQGAFALAMIPLAVAAAPIYPPAAAQFALYGAMHGAGAVMEHRSAPTGPNVCTYVGALVVLAAEPKP